MTNTLDYLEENTIRVKLYNQIHSFSGRQSKGNNQYMISFLFSCK